MVVDKKKNFFGRAGPVGYIAGVGRGSDIGPAREATDITSLSDERNPQLRARQKKLEEQMQAADKFDDDDDNLNDANYDEFSGYESNLFSKDPYEKDDEEADQIYKLVDERMDERRKERREEKLKQELLKYRKERPKIQQRFIDLKKKLAQVSDIEWNNIPEVGDTRNRKARNPRAEKFTPVPDSVIVSNYNSTRMDSKVSTSAPSTNGFMTPFPGSGSSGTATSGFITPGTGSSVKLDLSKMSEARRSLVGMKLDQASDSVTGQTVVDPKGYLTDLQSLTPSCGGDIGDIKKARLLLNSIITSNPKHGPGWIAAARLEEVTGQMDKARNIIHNGTQKCPLNEDVWLESIRLHPIKTAKHIVSLALDNLPQSVRLWMKAAELEDGDIIAQKKVFRKALENIPNSVRLWKATVELEEPADALILLGRAVECCTSSVELWLALANLETYENARKVLNRAREKIPTDRLIWITAAKLEEENNNLVMVEKIIDRAIISLTNNGVEINRDQWIKDAEECDKGGFISTCQSIVKAVIHHGIEPQDCKHVWMEDADSCITNSAFNCARAIYSFALNELPNKKSVWLRAVYFEKNHGSSEQLDSILYRANLACPKSEILWLMAAKSKWMAKDVPGARKILSNAFQANPNSEEIWLAAIKLESENNEHDRARRLLVKARTNSPTARIFMKSAKLEWVLNSTDEALKLIEEGISKYPSFEKFYMMKGQIFCQIGKVDLALEAYKSGIDACKLTSSALTAVLWRLYADLTAKQFGMIKARSIYEHARTVFSKNAYLWLASIKIELAHENKGFANVLLSKALNECPNDGRLWFESIFLALKVQRKSKSVEALKKCEHDIYVVLAVALLFWSERKITKAREWFKRAIKISKNNGDVWCYYYKFESQYGTQAEKDSVINDCINSEPRYGELWCPFIKDPKNWKMEIKDALLYLVDTIKPIESL